MNEKVLMNREADTTLLHLHLKLLYSIGTLYWEQFDGLKQKSSKC